MFCYKCGIQNPDGARFCNSCGSTQEDSASAPQPLFNAKQKVKRSSTPLRRTLTAIFCVGLALIGVLVIAVLVEQYRTDKFWKEYWERENAQSQQLTLAPTPAPTPYWKTESYKVDQTTLAIQPGHYWRIGLQVNDGWRNARLVGKFTAQGGGGNDVEAFVTDEDGLVNFKNDHRFNVWYQSGRVTVDSVNARLPAGKSYLVFSNTFSLLAHKSVTFDLRVEYEHLVQP